MEWGQGEGAIASQIGARASEFQHFIGWHLTCRWRFFCGLCDHEKNPTNGVKIVHSCFDKQKKFPYFARPAQNKAVLYTWARASFKKFGIHTP